MSTIYDILHLLLLKELKMYECRVFQVSKGNRAKYYATFKVKGFTDRVSFKAVIYLGQSVVIVIKCAKFE